jgi:hypothetical protein
MWLPSWIVGVLDRGDYWTVYLLERVGGSRRRKRRVTFRIVHKSPDSVVRRTELL